MAKKLAGVCLAILLILSIVKPVFAQEKQANIYFFWGEGCPHCAHEKPFLEKLEQTYPGTKVYDYEIWTNSDNRTLLIEISSKLNVNVSGVPFTVVGDQYFAGWFNEETTGRDIENALVCALRDGCRDIVAEIMSAKQAQQPDEACGCEQTKQSLIPSEIYLPVIGKINPRNFSLPALTIILGGLDGFNPCAMWTLLFLISLLLGMEDKKRRWILGIAFIMTSAFVYFLFMTAWLNLLLFFWFYCLGKDFNRVGGSCWRRI